MTSEVHRVPDRDPEGGPDSPPNPPTRPDPTNTLAEVSCGSSLAEESIHRFGLHRASGQRMDGPQAAGFAGGF